MYNWKTTKRAWCVAACAVPSMALAACAIGPSVDETFYELEGNWSWRGYNRVVTLSDETYSASAITDISCVPFRSGGLAELGGLLGEISKDNEDLFIAQDSQGVNKYYFDRLEALPQTCSVEPDQGPEFAFEVFWRYFDENYAFFDAKGIDWKRRYDEYRPQVTANTSDDELFSILTAMLEGFNDQHTNLLAGGFEEIFDPNSSAARYNAGRRSASDTVFAELYYADETDSDQKDSKQAHKLSVLLKINDHLKNGILKGKFEQAAGGRVLWGEAAPGIGYFAVHAMAGLVGDRADVTVEQEVAGVENAMDNVIIPFLNDMNAVIIDLRFNSGGHDGVALAIASRFADQMRLAFRKSVWTGDGYAPAREVWVSPKGPQQFTKPIYLLTSSMTASASEIFVLATLDMPHVERIGANTNGIFSDVWFGPLPNGWLTSLSNEKYETADGSVYEGLGVPPDLEAPVFVPGAFWENLDAAYGVALRRAQAQ